ncbi:MAG: hypothetical protein V4625_02595 [Pseudomonadota bacterium]
MKIFSWFDARAARECGVSLAKLVLKELPAGAAVKEKKFAEKADKTLNHVTRELAVFKQKHGLNAYQKAKLGNAFLWTLKDSGVNDAYADQLTEWLALRL